MKEYYIAISDNKEGPLSLDDLKVKKLTKDTLVWYDGLENWVKASEVNELKDLLKSENSIQLKKVKTSNTDNHKQSKSNKVTEKIRNKSSKKMFSNVFGFKGRIRRLEYGLSYLAYIFIYSLFSAKPDSLLILFSLWVMIYVLIAQGAKRCHDRGNSGWYQIIPFYFLWMIFGEGDKESNYYGPSPK